MQARKLIALLFIAAILATAPYFVGPFTRTLIAEILIFALFALSIEVIYGHTGMLSFGQAGFFGVGAYSVALAIIHAKVGIFTALFCAIVSSTLLAVFVAAFAVQLRGHYFALITIVMGLILYYAATAWRSVTNAEDGLNFSRPLLFERLSLSDPIVSYYFVLAVFVVVFLLIRHILLSPLGRVFRALRENEDRVRYLGYNVVRLKMLSFAISGALAGFAGGMFALFSAYANTEFLHWTLSGEPVMWSMVGGIGSIYGPVIGTALLIYLREGLSSYLIHVYPIIVGVVIIGTIVYFPRGIVGAVKTLADRFRSLRAEARP
jgi:branched-chain amino acid transport system permease protein